MWIDLYSLFAEGQTLGSGEGATALTDHVNLGSDRDIGPGRTLYWVVQLDTIAGDDLAFTLQTDDNSSFSSATTIATLNFSENDAAGTRLFVGFPNTNEQYLRALVTPDGDDASTTFTSWLTDQEPKAWQAYPDAVPS